MGRFSSNIKPTSSLLKKNMDFYDYNNVNVENVNFETVTIYNINGFNRDFNLNEVSEHSDFSDTKVVQPYFDFESSMNIEDMMTALDEDIIFSNDGPIPDNDNSFANLEDKFEDICNTIENNDFDQEYQPESPESCTSDEDLSTSDEEYEPNEPQKKSQPQKRISKKPAKYQSTDEEYHTSESETEEQTEKRRVQCRKAPNIAHWLLTLLDENSSAIGWTHNSHGEFKILDQKKLAKMWGERKGNKRMTYNNVARTMRYHYKKSRGQELEVVNRKLVYKFSKKFLETRRA